VLLFTALEGAVLAPAAAVIETDLRLQLFAVDDAKAGGDAAAAEQVARAAADAAAAARWAAPLATLPPLRLVNSTVHIR